MSLTTTEIQALIARFELQVEASWTDKAAKLLAEKTLEGLRELLSLRIEAQRLKEREGGAECVGSRDKANLAIPVEGIVR